VAFEGGATLVVPSQIAAELGLGPGSIVDEEQLERLRAEAEISQARGRGLRFLEARERSRAELCNRLARYGYSERTVERVAGWLEDLGYIDDVRFTAGYVRSSRRRSLGPRRIRAELRLKGVSPDIIECALNEGLDTSPDSAQREVAELEALVRRKFGRLMLTDPVAARRRAVGFLARRGYQGGVIDAVIKAVEQDPEGSS